MWSWCFFTDSEFVCSFFFCFLVSRRENGRQAVPMCHWLWSMSSCVMINNCFRSLILFKCVAVGYGNVDLPPFFVCLPGLGPMCQTFSMFRLVCQYKVLGLLMSWRRSGEQSNLSHCSIEGILRNSVRIVLSLNLLSLLMKGFSLPWWRLLSSPILVLPWQVCVWSTWMCLWRWSDDISAKHNPVISGKAKTNLGGGRTDVQVH